jgi:hypothetical protein
VRMGLVSKHLNEWDVTHKKKKKRNWFNLRCFVSILILKFSCLCSFPLPLSSFPTPHINITRRPQILQQNRLTCTT